MSTDFIREIEEDIRRDRWKALWRRFGFAASLAVLLIVGGVAGYTFWQQQQLRDAQAETARLIQLTATPASAPQADRIAAAAALVELADTADEGRAALARLRAAALFAASGELERASELWSIVSRDDALPLQIRELATITWALHSSAVADVGALNAALRPLDRPDGSFRFSARELLALLALRENDTGRAVELLRSLSADPQAPQGVRSRAADLAALYGAPQ